MLSQQLIKKQIKTLEQKLTNSKQAYSLDKIKMNDTDNSLVTLKDHKRTL